MAEFSAALVFLAASVAALGVILNGRG